MMDMYLDGLNNMQRNYNLGIYLLFDTDMLYVMLFHITKTKYRR